MTAPAYFNIASHLATSAAQRPFAHAVIFPHGRDRDDRVSYTHLTYAQLNAECDLIARGLRTIGIQEGDRVVLMVTPSLDFFALTFALLKLGAVMVMIDPGMGLANLGQCIAEAAPQGFIGIGKAHAARVIYGWGRDTVRIRIRVGKPWFPGVESLREVREKGAAVSECRCAETRADAMAAILFTSGSTGVPKGAVYTHGTFYHQIEALRNVFGIEPGEVDLATFPLFALFAPALGMTAVIPDMDATRPAHVDPRRIFEAIEDFGVQHFFGSPALIDRVSRYGVAHGVTLPSLKRAVSAGAPVGNAVLERFSRMLEPQIPIYTPYGATEALPVAVIDSQTILSDTRAATDEGKGVCVGYPVPGVTVTIIAIDDAPIAEWTDDLCVAEGEIGEIVVAGGNVTECYYNRPESTKSAKIRDPATGRIFHRMGDVGYVDATGRLWFCGRKSHRVILDDTTLFTVPCEAVFNTHAFIYRTALVGVMRGPDTIPVICVELEPEHINADRRALREALHASGECYSHTRRIQTFLFHPSFPVDIRHNAKIFRDKLAVWAAKQPELT